MSPSAPFILRPVATALLMAAILLVGIVSYTQLPVSALPQVDYPTIQVLTFYPGASPYVVATTVTAPPPAEASTVSVSSCFCNFSIRPCICCTWRSIFNGSFIPKPL